MRVVCTNPPITFTVTVEDGYYVITADFGWKQTRVICRDDDYEPMLNRLIEDCCQRGF